MPQSYMPQLVVLRPRAEQWIPGAQVDLDPPCTLRSPTVTSCRTIRDSIRPKIRDIVIVNGIDRHRLAIGNISAIRTEITGIAEAVPITIPLATSRVFRTEVNIVRYFIAVSVR